MPGQYDMLKNADISGSDEPPSKPSATEPYNTTLLWHVKECRCTQAIGNLTYSDIGWSVFCSCLQNTSIIQDPERRQTPQKHVSWMNNRQVTQITYATLYKHEDYFQSRPIYSYPSTNNLMYYNTKVLLSRNRQMYPLVETSGGQDQYHIKSALHLFVWSFHV